MVECRPALFDGGDLNLTPYVLVVEDEDALATLLQYNLEKEGYDVGVAADGEEALTQVDERLLADLFLASSLSEQRSDADVSHRAG